MMQAAKGELEDQMAAVRSQLEAMKDTETSLQVWRSRQWSAWSIDMGRVWRKTQRHRQLGAT